MQTTSHVTDSLQADPRWHLVQRVIVSPAFVRSARLSEFLLFVSEATLLGQATKLNEQEIGVKVFGRSPGYLQSDDNIVRSNASRLRQRLDEYFAHEGQAEQLRITLPKGGYVPEFMTSSAASALAETTLFPGNDAAITPAVESPGRRIAIVIALLAMFGSAATWFGYSNHWGHKIIPDAANTPSNQFWTTVFDPRSPVLLVPADSSLVLYETMTHHEVPLAAYINGVYRAKSDDGTDDLTNPKGLAQRRLTSMADLEFVASIGRQAAAAKSQWNIRYARDLEMQDIKKSSLILLGARESNPWVTLFDDERNFTLTSDQATRISTIHNQHPLTGEFESLHSHPQDPQHRAYALVAYIPSHSEGKHVLILEGTSIAGTEAATDFILDSATMDTLLTGHMKSEQVTPYFELVLQLNDFSGTAPRAQVLASRFWY